MEDKAKRLSKYYPLPEGGYKISTTSIVDLGKCEDPNGPQCIHHMFDGPFKARVYYNHDATDPVLGVEVECGKVKLLSIPPEFVDASGCSGASKGLTDVYVHAGTQKQQKAMARLVREALIEEGLQPISTSYEVATIQISPDPTSDTTTIKVTNDSSMVVVNETIQGLGEDHASLFPCPDGNIPPLIPRPT